MSCGLEACYHLGDCGVNRLFEVVRMIDVQYQKPILLDMTNRQSRLPVTLKQRSDEWQSLVERRNKLTRERAALQNGIKLKNNEIDDIHAKLSSLGFCLSVCLSVYTSFCVIIRARSQDQSGC